MSRFYSEKLKAADTGGVSKRTDDARTGDGLRATGSDHSGTDPQREGGAAFWGEDQDAGY